MYKHTVFISYKRQGDNEKWVNEVFYPIITNYFIDEYGKNYAFKDHEQLNDNYGNSLGNFLNSGLTHSKCMIAVLSNPYFCKSEWCAKEFSVMKHRTDYYNQNMLFPVFFTRKNDSEILLSQACPILTADISVRYTPLLLDEEKYYQTNKAFLEGAYHSELKTKVRNWLRGSVVPAIMNVPTWNNDWNSEDWLERPYENFKNIIDCAPIYKQALL